MFCDSPSNCRNNNFLFFKKTYKTNPYFYHQRIQKTAQTENGSVPQINERRSLSDISAL
jgi:hypothetical protein